VLPGIGPVKAQAIVDYRKANGPFKSLDDLKKVNGIGDATFNKLKSDIAISGASTPAKATAPAAAAAPAPSKAAAPAPATPPPPAPKAEPAKGLASAASTKDAKAPATAAPAKDAKSKDAKAKDDAPKK